MVNWKKGCTVIAFTSTDKKVEWCKELGFDHVFNYTQVDFSQAISKVAPKGAHMFFDNVTCHYFIMPLQFPIENEIFS